MPSLEQTQEQDLIRERHAFASLVEQATNTTESKKNRRLAKQDVIAWLETTTQALIDKTLAKKIADNPVSHAWLLPPLLRACKDNNPLALHSLSLIGTEQSTARTNALLAFLNQPTLHRDERGKILLNTLALIKSLASEDNLDAYLLRTQLLSLAATLTKTRDLNISSKALEHLRDLQYNSALPTDQKNIAQLLQTQLLARIHDAPAPVQTKPVALAILSGNQSRQAASDPQRIEKLRTLFKEPRWKEIPTRSQRGQVLGDPRKHNSPEISFRKQSQSGKNIQVDFYPDRIAIQGASYEAFRKGIKAYKASHQGELPTISNQPMSAKKRDLWIRALVANGVKDRDRIDACFREKEVVAQCSIRPGRL